MVGHFYVVGDRIIVSGGYDPDPVWLAGGEGYAGTLVLMAGSRASVELDAELKLSAPISAPWADFGAGADRAIRTAAVATGRWLCLRLAYVDARWVDPILRLHVSVCEQAPDLSAIPSGGGVGYWVESHATCKLDELRA